MSVLRGIIARNNKPKKQTIYATQKIGTGGSGGTFVASMFDPKS
jgi:hypothetical protein